MSRKTQNDVLQRIEMVYGKPPPPIVDAIVPLRLQPIKADCDGADPKSIDNCAFVHTAQRQYGARAAIFFKELAYVDLIDPKTNKRAIFRHRMTRAAIKVVTDFDTGKPFREGMAIVLLPIPEKQRLPIRRANAKRWRKTSAGKLAADLARAVTAHKKAEGEVDRTTAKVDELAQKTPASPKLKTARKQLRIARETFTTARERLAKARKQSAKYRVGSDAPRPRKHRAFDLTTRNGAAGHYNFVSNGA